MSLSKASCTNCITQRFRGGMGFHVWPAFADFNDTKKSHLRARGRQGRWGVNEYKRVHKMKEYEETLNFFFLFCCLMHSSRVFVHFQKNSLVFILFRWDFFVSYFSSLLFSSVLMKMKTHFQKLYCLDVCSRDKNIFHHFEMHVFSKTHQLFKM